MSKLFRFYLLVSSFFVAGLFLLTAPKVASAQNCGQATYNSITGCGDGAVDGTCSATTSQTTYNCTINSSGSCTAWVNANGCYYNSSVNSCQYLSGGLTEIPCASGSGGGGTCLPEGTCPPGLVAVPTGRTFCSPRMPCGPNYYDYLCDDAGIGDGFHIVQQICVAPSPTPTRVPSTPTTAPAPAYCQNIRAYNTSWVALTSTQLSALRPGNSVYYCVYGTAGTGTFDKARFTINGSLKPETTTRRPGSSDFCYLHTIPTGTANFTVVGEIHNTVLGWLR